MYNLVIIIVNYILFSIYIYYFFIIIFLFISIIKLNITLLIAILDISSLSLLTPSQYQCTKNALSFVRIVPAHLSSQKRCRLSCLLPAAKQWIAVTSLMLCRQQFKNDVLSSSNNVLLGVACFSFKGYETAQSLVSSISIYR